MLPEDNMIETTDGGISLDQVKIRSRARILGIRGGWGGHERLLSLGIGPGVEVEMVSVHPLHGPVVIQLDGTQVAIGRSLARKIIVEHM